MHRNSEIVAALLKNLKIKTSTTLKTVKATLKPKVREIANLKESTL